MSGLKIGFYVDLDLYCAERGLDPDRLRRMIVYHTIPEELIQVNWMVDEKGLDEWGKTHPLLRAARLPRFSSRSPGE